MILKFEGSTDECTKYVEGVLPIIGEITAFEVYQNKEDLPKQCRDAPYQYIAEGKVKAEKINYHLILRNPEKDIEIWLSGCNCGYGGHGPRATEEILQMCGLKDDFLIDKEPVVKEILLSPIKRFNILVTSGDLFNRKYYFYTGISFDYPYQLIEIKKALCCFGFLDGITKLELYDEPVFDWFKALERGEKEWCGYATHNLFVLNNNLRSFSREQLKVMLASIVEENGGNVYFLDCK